MASRITIRRARSRLESGRQSLGTLARSCGLSKGFDLPAGKKRNLVRSSGFEPPRYCYRQPLKLVRLPVPPRPHRSENFIVNAPPQSGKAPMECAECGSPAPAFTEEASAPSRDYSGHPELTASQASTEQAAVASTIAVVPQAALESPESGSPEPVSSRPERASKTSAKSNRPAPHCGQRARPSPSHTP